MEISIALLLEERITTLDWLQTEIVDGSSLGNWMKRNFTLINEAGKRSVPPLHKKPKRITEESEEEETTEDPIFKYKPTSK